MLNRSLSSVLLFVLSFALGACFTPTLRVNGKPMGQDGKKAAYDYYAPQLAKLKARDKPVADGVVFALPNQAYARANWVKVSGASTGTGRASKAIEQLTDFSKTTWEVLAGALGKQKLFTHYRQLPTADGTSELAQPEQLAAGTLVIGHNAKNQVVVYRHPARERGVTIKDKLSPGSELATMTRLIVSAIGRLQRTGETAKAPVAKPRVAKPDAAKARAIVAVFDVQTSRLKLAADLRQSLADQAATALAATALYRVVPRSQLRARLRKEKRASYRLCVDSACQVAIGRELAAQKSLALTIAKIGSRCQVSVVLYDLKSAASEKAANASGACTEDGYLAALKQVIAKLAR
jgi:hypothetical protein